MAASVIGTVASAVSLDQKGAFVGSLVALVNAAASAFDDFSE
jgi:hypothetical protein